MLESSSSTHNNTSWFSSDRNCRFDSGSASSSPTSVKVKAESSVTPRALVERFLNELFDVPPEKRFQTVVFKNAAKRTRAAFFLIRQHQVQFVALVGPQRKASTPWRLQPNDQVAVKWLWRPETELLPWDAAYLAFLGSPLEVDGADSGGCFCCSRVKVSARPTTCRPHRDGGETSTKHDDLVVLDLESSSGGATRAPESHFFEGKEKEENEEDSEDGEWVHLE